MKKQDNNFNIITIWKWLRSEKGKRYSFIIFYLFFFIFLFVFFNFDYSSNKKEISEEPKPESSLPFITSNLENKTYSFIYIISCSNKKVYNGLKNEKNYTFKFNNNIYTYQLINGDLKGDINISYIDFSNVYFLRQIIKNSKLVSETKMNEMEEYLYNYKIKNNILSNYLPEEINEDLETEITIKTDNKKVIKEVNVKISNDCNFQNIIGGDNE